MPPSDPSMCPALTVARPDDFSEAASDPATHREPWSVQFGDHDNTWHNVTVTSRWHRPDGREIITIEWSVNGMLWTETYFTEPAKMRKRWTDRQHQDP